MDDEKATDQVAQTVRLDAMSVRGLAHPLRVKILGFLRTEGSATATMVAQRMGLNSGATSYHLRQLATYGFVVDDPERGVGRERWWRAAHAITQWDADDTGADGSGEAYLRAVAQTYIERIQLAADSYGTLPQQWQHASTMSDYVLRLTAAESAQLNAELLELLGRYRRHDPDTAEQAPAGSLPVSVQIQTLPHAQALAEGEAAAAQQATAPDEDLER